MKELTFYRCNVCGNLSCMIHDSGVTPTCCGEEMEAVTANAVDASNEAHVPVIRQEETRVYVSIGSMPHPMLETHFIEWIILQTNRGAYFHRLCPSTKPEACFKLCSDEHPVRAYAWCNLHSLWVHNCDP